MTTFEIKDRELAWDYGATHEIVVERVPVWRNRFFKKQKREGIPIRNVSGQVMSDGASVWFEGSVQEIDG